MAMVDWTILSPNYLSALVEWAGAVVTVHAIGADQATSDIHARGPAQRRLAVDP
jgi:hypothetical protein